jgi:hypothetical protein
MKSSRDQAPRLEAYKKVSIVSTGENYGANPGPMERMDLHRLRLARRNACTHTKKQIRQIADPMSPFGVCSGRTPRSQAAPGHPAYAHRGEVEIRTERSEPSND